MATKKILLIDDDVLFTDSLSALFKNHGWETLVINDCNGIETTITTFEPQVILLDIFMPEKNGLDILKDLSATNPEWNKKIIMLTSMDGEVYLAKALEFGVNTYLQKDDATSEQILARVEQKYIALDEEKEAVA